MRLTLRNMLAYMDGLLDAGDAEDIGRRIEESEQASSLLHRTRDVMRRLRLTAPSVTDRGPGLDPNTVAEYLDHTLHESRVTDFEKVCLDSDVHLAEVASCHQILALVLGEAAEIDPASRQRMYQLPALEAAEAPPVPPPAETSSGDGEPGSQPAPPRPRRRPTVPDYLREPLGKRRLLPIAVALALVACLAVIVLGALGQFKSGTPLGNALAYLRGADQADLQGPAQGEAEPADQPGAGPPRGPATESPKQPAAHPPDEPATAPPDEPATAPPEEPATAPPENPHTQPLGEPDVVPLPGPPKGLGGLMSEKQVLLWFEPEAAHWQRVPQQGIVAAGQKVLSLPTYRPLIALMSAEITIQLVDGTQAELLPTDAAGVPGLEVDFGRLVIRTVGKPEAQIRLQVGERSGLVTFTDAQSVLAMDVIPIRIPGSDPEVEPGSVVAEMYAEAGQVFWEEAGGGQGVPIPAGNWVMLGQHPTPGPAPLKEFPTWIAGEDMGLLEKGADRLASTTVEKRLEVERSQQFGATLALMELNDHSRIENRWLAARCLGYLDEFGPLVATLNDADYPPVWTDEAVEHLRAAVARGAETAARVRGALEKQYGQDAPALYRMLWGYTLEGLRNGRQAQQLVEHLDHETLAVRTLSFWNLRNLFGLTLQYRVADKEPARRVRSQRWRQRLESGEIWTKLSGESRPAAAAEKPMPPDGAEQEP